MKAMNKKLSAELKEMKNLQSRLAKTMATEEHDRTQATATNNKNKKAKTVVKKRQKVSVAPKKRKSPPTAENQRKKSKTNQRENTVTHKKKPAPTRKPKPIVIQEDGDPYDSDAKHWSCWRAMMRTASGPIWQNGKPTTRKPRPTRKQLNRRL